MKAWYDTKYGKAPYKEVLKVNFSFSDIKQIDVAYKQYKLLLCDEVVQAHMEYATGKAIALFVPGTNPEQVLKSQEIKYQILDKELISYETVLASNNMFVDH